MKELLLLTPKNNKPTKILDKDLNKLESFDAGWLFYFETVQYDNFHQAIKSVLKEDSCFLTLGELTDHGQSFEEGGTCGPRRKKADKSEPTIRDKDGAEIVLDLDDHIIEGFDALDPEPAITKWLKEKKIFCDVTWQITSGQKLGTEEARIRLYMESEKEHSLKYRKAWSQGENIDADGSVYTCSQPIYTAPPIIQDAEDPIPNRHGFIKGKKRKITLPAISRENVTRYSAFNRGAEDYDFNDPSLPEDVLNGKVYRRYFMPLAFHYANLLKGDREAIFHIISGKAASVKSRNFSAENVYSFIDDALKKIDHEEEEKDDDILKAKDFHAMDGLKMPEFPEGLMESWPAPWPMIWDNFKRIPRQMEEPLLVPTILSLNGYFLRGNYVTSYGRRPNMLFLNLTPSTGNKDVNSKNVIRDVDEIFRKRGVASSIFSGILNTESSITADTTFLSSFSESGELFWINTEATRIFQQIKTSGNISAVAALSDKLIELVDGHEITGKNKVGGKVKTIPDPNAQVLFYAQPETIERYIDEDMVDSGLFGRALLSIMPDLKFDQQNYNMFLDKGATKKTIDDEFFEFYTNQKFNLSQMSAGKKVLAPSKENLILLNSWAREYVAPLMAENESFQKVLSRVGNSAEQLYCIVLGICQLYDAFMEQDVREEIPILPLIPMLEYWVDTKVYAIKQFVNTSLDPMADGIMEVIQECLTGKIKLTTIKDMNLVRDQHVVPKSQIFRILKNRTKLIRKLAADGDKKNAIVRANQILSSLINNGVLIEKLINGKECVGITK